MLRRRPRPPGEGLLNQVVSHLVERLTGQGRTHLFVYTKVSTAKFFQDLGFYEIARVENTLSFLENRKNGFARFCARLSQSRTEEPAAAIVMNANPFTLGHRYLVEEAKKRCDLLHIFVVSEDASLVPFADRFRLVREGCEGLPGVIFHETESYMISSATFPSYFLRDGDTVIRSHAALDISVFSRIAGKLGIRRRFAGEEPFSHVTALYNRTMEEELPRAGLEFVQIPRREFNGTAISASRVRELIRAGRTEEIRPWCRRPPTAISPPKPGRGRRSGSAPPGMWSTTEKPKPDFSPRRGGDKKVCASAHTRAGARLRQQPISLSAECASTAERFYL